MDRVELLEHFRHLQTFSSEIPERILRSNDSVPPPKYKVRRGWFQGVTAGVQVLLEKGYGDHALRQHYEKFMQIYKTNDAPGRLNTREDIRNADILLEHAVRTLEWGRCSALEYSAAEL